MSADYIVRRLDSPWVSLLVVAVLAALFISGRLYQSHFDPSSFVVAGDKFCVADQVPQNLTVLKQSAGFDGQFYYRLSLNPFTSQVTEFGITLDVPSLRHQRILYPIVAWILSFGNAGLVPTVMILINFISLSMMGLVGGSYAQSLKQHALWGVFLPLYPGFLFSLSRDLVEILEIALLTGSLLLIRRSKPVIATLLLVLAVLTKETALLVAVAALLVYVLELWKGENSRTVRWYYFAVPMAVFCCWQLVLFYNWRVFPILDSTNSNLGLPLVGVARALLDAASLQTALQRRNLMEFLFLIGLTFGIFYHLRSTAASFLEIVACLLFGALALSLSSTVWLEDWTFFRAVAEFCVLGTVVMIASRYKLKTYVFACSTLFWLYLFIRMMRHYS